MLLPSFYYSVWAAQQPRILSESSEDFTQISQWFPSHTEQKPKSIHCPTNSRSHVFCSFSGFIFMHSPPHSLGSLYTALPAVLWTCQAHLNFWAFIPAALSARKTLPMGLYLACSTLTALLKCHLSNEDFSGHFYLKLQLLCCLIWPLAFIMF